MRLRAAGWGLALWVAFVAPGVSGAPIEVTVEAIVTSSNSSSSLLRQGELLEIRFSYESSIPGDSGRGFLGERRWTFPSLGAVSLTGALGDFAMVFSDDALGTIVMSDNRTLPGLIVCTRFPCPGRRHTDTLTLTPGGKYDGKGDFESDPVSGWIWFNQTGRTGLPDLVTSAGPPRAPFRFDRGGLALVGEDGAYVFTAEFGPAASSQPLPEPAAALLFLLALSRFAMGSVRR